MMRLSFALAIFMAIAPTAASAATDSSPIVLARLQEESLGAQDLQASPAAATSPGTVTSPGADTDTDSDNWSAVPPGKVVPQDGTMPVVNTMPANAPQAAPVQPAEIAPALDAGSIASTPQISDASLTPMISTAPTPARAASLRITEQERVELEQGHTDEAIRQLEYAISIDPSNSYAYFYLGRAYVARKDYGQAQTFFKRAEIGMGTNPVWLGEAYAFEGLSLEQAGKSPDAAIAYQKALAASPGNLTARVGMTRMSAYLPATAAASAPAGQLDQPAPAEPSVPSAPEEAPAPPPPASAPPPAD